MGKAQELECPSCHGTVTLGEVTCPHCGVNLKSGESFEAQVKRAKGKAKHKEIYTGGLYAGIILAVGVVVFAGFMYQRSMQKIIASRSAVFAPLIERMEHVRDLADAGKYGEARQTGEALLKDLQAADDAIKPGVAFDVGQVSDSYSRLPQTNKPKGDERAAKRLLANMITKTHRLIDTLPAS